MGSSAVCNAVGGFLVGYEKSGGKIERGGFFGRCIIKILVEVTRLKLNGVLL